MLKNQSLLWDEIMPKWCLLHKHFEIKQIFKVLTFNRFCNLFLLINSYLLSVIIKKPILWAYPFAITIEPITNCNLSCEECPTGKKTLTRPLGKISLEFFKKIVDEVYKKTFYLNLYLQGEPFIHPDIIEMLEYAVNKKMFVCISTNGHFLDSETCSKIVKSGIQKLIISLDGATEETYLKYRIGGDFNKVTVGIKNLSDSKKKLKSNTPEIIIQMLINKYNEHEISIAKDLTCNLGANKFVLKTMQIYNDFDFLPDSKKFKRYLKSNNGSFVINRKIHNRCYRLWSNAVFTFDGNIIPCCFDKNAEYKFGNINVGENSNMGRKFKELWTSDDFNNFRSSVLKNRKKHQICQNCTE